MIHPSEDIEIRSRWAPTPSGYLHIGNVFNFLITWLLTRSSPKGCIRLRIDDLDAARVREEYLDDIFQTLDWLGLEWEAGPTTVEQHQRAFSQRLRLADYQAALARMRAQEQLFACDCSRKQIQTNSTDGQYPGTCCERNLSFEKEKHAWRLFTPNGTEIAWEDGWQGRVGVDIWANIRYPVLKRKDGISAYQLASVLDDIAHGINLIVRGTDLMDSTGLQLYVSQCLQEKAFSDISFWHHPLLLNAEGNKLSKSKGALAIRSLREKQGGKAHLFQAFAEAMGWAENPDSARALLEVFERHRSFPKQLDFLIYPKGEQE